MTDNDPTPRDEAGNPQQPDPYPGRPASQEEAYGLGQVPGQWQRGYGDTAAQPGSGPYYPGQPSHPYQHNPYGGQYVTPAYPSPPPVRESGKQHKGSGKLVAGVAVLALLLGGAAGSVGGYFAGGAADGSGSVNALQSVPAKDDSPAPEGSTEDVVNKTMPSVVQVKVPTPRGVASGSGFVISSDGYIMTNNHVVEPATEGGGKVVVQLSDGQKSEATIVGRDPTTDIAVIRVEGVDDLDPAELGRSANLKVGQSLVAFGAPFKLSGTVTEGIVSSLHRPVTAGGEGELATVMDAIQTDAAINPGNSGGPLVNMQGQVIGINSAIYSPGSGASSGGQSSAGNVGIGFAIPIDQARRTANEIIKDGHATQTFIGATVTDAKQGGVLIVDVNSDSPAEKAGLKKGDVVTKIGDRNTGTKEELIAAIRTKAPGTGVTLTLQNGDTLDVELGGKPVQPN